MPDPYLLIGRQVAQYDVLEHLGTASVIRSSLRSHTGGVTRHRRCDPTTYRLALRCLARAFAAAQRLPVLWEAQRQHQWHQRQVRSLRDSRVLVAGTGDVGRGVGRAFAAVGCVVDGVSRRGGAGVPFRGVYPSARLHEAVVEADWIVLTLPLTEQTLGLFDRGY